jgi:hypothetical protein
VAPWARGCTRQGCPAATTAVPSAPRPNPRWVAAPWALRKRAASREVQSAGPSGPGQQRFGSCSNSLCAHRGSQQVSNRSSGFPTQNTTVTTMRLIRRHESFSCAARI